MLKKISLITLMMILSALVFSGCGSSAKKKVVKHTVEPTSSEEPTTEKPYNIFDATEAPSEADIENDTDYDKVLWGTTYSLFEDSPELKASVSLYSDGDKASLIVGITNNYDKSLSFSGKAFPKGSDGGYIGKKKISFDSIGPGNTCIAIIPCSEGMPSGEIRWKNLVLRKGKKEYVPWEADWALDTDDSDNLGIRCKFTFDEKIKSMNDVCGLLLSDDGLVVGIMDKFDFNKGTSIGTSKIPVDEILGSNPTDVAMFANPLK